MYLWIAGQELWPIPEGADRTPLDYTTFGSRTRKDDLAFFTFGFEWKEATKQLLQTIRTIIFPAVIYCVIVNTAYSVVLQGMGQIISFALIGAG